MAGWRGGGRGCDRLQMDVTCMLLFPPGHVGQQQGGKQQGMQENVGAQYDVAGSRLTQPALAGASGPSRRAARLRQCRLRQHSRWLDAQPLTAAAQIFSTSTSGALPAPAQTSHKGCEGLAELALRGPFSGDADSRGGAVGKGRSAQLWLADLAAHVSTVQTHWCRTCRSTGACTS